MFYTQISLLMSAFALLMCVTQLSLYRIAHTKRSTTIMLYTHVDCVHTFVISVVHFGLDRFSVQTRSSSALLRVL